MCVLVYLTIDASSELLPFAGAAFAANDAPCPSLRRIKIRG